VEPVTSEKSVDIAVASVPAKSRESKAKTVAADRDDDRDLY
jgi:hypothetical protein